MSVAVRKRLLHSLGATALGPVVAAIVQLVCVPVFLHAWGTRLYGEWLILCAIPGYLTLTDFGFGAVAGTDMTITAAGGDQNRTLKTFQSVWLLSTGVAVSILLCGAVAVFFLPLRQWLSISLLSQRDVQWIIILLAIQVVVGMQGSMHLAAFRCAGRFATGAFWGNLARLLESVAQIAVVLLGARPLLAAGVAVFARTATIAVSAILMHRAAPWLSFGIHHARWSEIRRLAKPAFAYMAFPAGNALSFQGSVLVVGHFLGAGPVVVFSTLRTMSRVAQQVATVIAHSTSPEISIAYGAGDASLTRRLHRYACMSTLWISIGLCLALLGSGPWLLNHWTHGRIAMDHTLFGLLLAVALMNSLWNMSYIALTALNLHSRISVYYVGVMFVSLLFAAVFVRLWGLPGMGVALLGTEIVLWLLVVSRTLEVLGESVGDYVLGLLRVDILPRLLLRRGGAQA